MINKKLNNALYFTNHKKKSEYTKIIYSLESNYDVGNSFFGEVNKNLLEKFHPYTKTSFQLDDKHFLPKQKDNHISRKECKL